MKIVIFYTKKQDQELELGRVWNEGGEWKGTVNEVFLNDLREWLSKSGEEIEEYLKDLQNRFDGTFLYASPYQEESG
jgi:hypothetical protein